MGLLTRLAAGSESRSRNGLVAAVTATLLLSACNEPKAPAAGDDAKRSLDQLVEISREAAGSAKETAAQARSLLEEVRKLSTKVDGLEKAAASAEANRKRGAIVLALETETLCDNDAACTNTARAICNRISYPNAVAARFTPGNRPVLNSVVCFD